MRRLLTIGFAVLLASVGHVRAQPSGDSTHEVLVVVGAAGAAEFGEGFAGAAEAWRRASAQAGAACTVLGLEGATDPAPADDREQLRAWLDSVRPDGERPVWLVYLGHGTWDGREARLNLRGPDVTATELAQRLARLHRPVVIVHGGSASGPFVPTLSAPGRVVITATTTGEEVNYARFGERFATAIADPEADIDRDGQVSVLEAWLTAARRVELFYAEAGRLATEHALLDDNGDKRGTPSEFFRGTRAVRTPEGGGVVDGRRAGRLVLVESAEERALTDAQRAARDALEGELEALRARKAAMPEADYLRALESVLRRLGAIYAEPAGGDS